LIRLAQRRVLWWTVVAALALVLGLAVSSLVYGAPRHLEPAPITLASYGTVTVVVQPPHGMARTWRMLRADTTALIEHGLSDVTDPTLAGYSGMLFEFAHPTSLSFWMKNTPLSLSLVFINPDGTLQPAMAMSPCGDTDTCLTYAPLAAYSFALEVPAGRLAKLGITPDVKVLVPAP
jgi:uncharacterized membrane protein (UPF0127 family)